jgi:ABC-type nickel/cobalt efflux system permease component RcnA
MMSRQERSISLPLIGAILLCLLIGIYLIWRRTLNNAQEDANNASSAAKHSVETNPADALKYWTADKMRNAKPAEMPQTDKLKRGKKRKQQPPHTAQAHQAE